MVENEFAIGDGTARQKEIKVDADEKAIKEALEAGETVEGATIVQSESLRIR